MQDIYGAFEIHVSVNPEQICLMKLYCAERNMKLILASATYGDNPNQLMMSKWKHGTSSVAILKAHSIATDMKDYGLEIVRVKIESMAHNKGVPLEKNTGCQNENYFEFHTKFPYTPENFKQLS